VCACVFPSLSQNTLSTNQEMGQSVLGAPCQYETVQQTATSYQKISNNREFFKVFKQQGEEKGGYWTR